MFGLFTPPALSPRLLRLKESPLFATLTPLELKIVDGLMHERRFLAEEIIFDEGEEGQALYLVMSGRVDDQPPVHEAAAANWWPSCRPGLLRRPGAAGQLAAQRANPRAMDNCELAVFFRADFMGLMETDAVIGYKIALALARHIGSRLRDWMTGKPQVEAL
jgi:CRP/FNR family cyclic AMP-dependent transcriptional regulator